MSWGKVATAPEYLQEIKKYCRQCPDDQAILELGSGFTTGRIHDFRGKSQALSLEHSEKWYNDIVGKAPHLKDYVKLAKPKEYNAGMYWFYDLDGIDLPPVYLVVADGPPGRSRSPGMFEIYSMLADEYVILLDDYNRPNYQCLLKIWCVWDDCTLEHITPKSGNPFGILKGRKKPAL